MIKGKSKFEWLDFCEGYILISKQKYTYEEAEAIAKRELDCETVKSQNAFATHRAGINDDGDPVVCWWFDYREYKRSVPVWAFKED
jgi:hypothetical protein